jgi:excisionase family DNA binding protein
VDQVAVYFAISVRTVYRLLDEGNLNGTKIRSCLRVSVEELNRNILKSWIPNIIILAPEKFKYDLLDDVRGWVKRQENLL